MNNINQNESVLIHNNQTRLLHGPALVVMGCFGILFNLVVCVVLFSNNFSRQSLDRFIGQLALTDLFQAISITITYIISIISIINPFWLSRLPLFANTIVCKFTTSCTGITVINSKLILVAISIERYRAILYPLKAPFSKSLTFAYIIVMWLISAVIGGLLGMFHQVIEDDDYSYTCTMTANRNVRFIIMIIFEFVAGIFPMIVISVAYTVIMIKISKVKPPMDSNKSQYQRQVLAKIKQRNQRIAILLIITILSTVSTSIYLINYMIITVSLYTNSQIISSIAFQNFMIASGTLTLCSCVINPILYNFVSTNFNYAIKNLCQRLF